jgi:uncharacterized C2H2 Zn-finger protein
MLYRCDQCGKIFREEHFDKHVLRRNNPPRVAAAASI